MAVLWGCVPLRRRRCCLCTLLCSVLVAAGDFCLIETLRISVCLSFFLSFFLSFYSFSNFFKFFLKFKIQRSCIAMTIILHSTFKAQCKGTDWWIITYQQINNRKQKTHLCLIFVSLTLLVSWAGPEHFSENIRSMIGYQPSSVFRLCWRYLTPTVCIVSDPWLLNFDLCTCCRSTKYKEKANSQQCLTHDPENRLKDQKPFWNISETYLRHHQLHFTIANQPYQLQFFIIRMTTT